MDLLRIVNEKMKPSSVDDEAYAAVDQVLKKYGKVVDLYSQGSFVERYERARWMSGREGMMHLHFLLPFLI